MAAIGKPLHGSLALQQVDMIAGQAAAAAKRGLNAGYWNTPAWPVGVRDRIWDLLVKEGMGMLNVDDLKGGESEELGGLKGDLRIWTVGWV